MPSIFKRILRVVTTLRSNLAMPLRLEFNLTDLCNLNCKGCTHYSPLASADFTSLESLERDARHLGAACAADIDAVHLMGGETLLYPRLHEAMAILRRHFPTNPIKLFTNGLLLHRMSPDFWKECRRHNIIIHLTRYPIKFDYTEAIRLIESHHVDYQFFADRTQSHTFFRFGLDPCGKNNARLSHLRCIQRGCITVSKSRIYPCSISACIHHLNSHLEQKFEHHRGDYIPVEQITSARQLLRLRNHPVPFCAYCVHPITEVTYGPSKRDISEWVDIPDSNR